MNWPTTAWTPTPVRKGGLVALLALSNLLALGATIAHAQDLLLTEFMAANTTTLLDVDGDPSDWIEVYNPTEATVSTAGWALTDDVTELDMWLFPAVELRPGQFLIVFASDKDRRDPERELHTNFRLSRRGDFLALVDPTGELATSFSPEYPEQRWNASYGLEMDGSADELVGTSAPATWLVTRSSTDLADDWNLIDFDDSAWTAGTSDVGFDLKPDPDLLDLFTTDLGASMQNQNSSVFLRIPFDLTEAESHTFLQLRAQLDSGFVAFINGVEVGSVNAPERVRVNSSATVRRSSAETREPEPFPLNITPGMLVEGRNVLGIQAMNDARASQDFLFRAALETLRVTGVRTEMPAFFSVSSPALSNPALGESGIAPEPTFSVDSGQFSGTVTVEITTSSPTAEIRYTLNSIAEPGPDDTLYAGPLELTTATRIRARVFEPGLVPSPVRTRSYVATDPAIFEFSSNLPLFVVETFGRPIFDNGDTPMHMEVVDTDPITGRAALDLERDFVGMGTIKERGASTSGNPKGSFGFELQNELGVDDEAEILGLPEESDWILYGPIFDVTLLRNVYAYELSRRIGRWASRTRICELFLNRDGDQVDAEDYRGIYVFMEKIKRDSERVDVEKMGPDDNFEPELTGGYMWKIDPPDPGDNGFLAGGLDLLWVHPKEEDLTEPQADFARTYINSFVEALNGENFADPETGYAAFVDVDSWIDHHIINEFSKNPDGFKKSSYFHKPRGEKIIYGPIWDFNIAFGPGTRSDGDATGWSGVRFVGWWGRFFDDPTFVERYVARWRELRQGTFSTPNLVGLLDELVAETQEAQERNSALWLLAANDTRTWQGEVDALRNWLVARADWMDRQLEFELRGGGFQLQGDIDQDQSRTITDAIRFLDILQGRVFDDQPGGPCESEEANATFLDINGDTRTDLTDVVQLMNFLFLGGSAPTLGTECVPLSGCPDVCATDA